MMNYPPELTVVFDAGRVEVPLEVRSPAMIAGGAKLWKP
jgi:hypothetical protein